MKKYLILLPLIALVFAGLFMTPVYAMSYHQPGSAEFGRHIAFMTPEHPQIHGVMFGNMISNMAQGNSCH